MLRTTVPFDQSGIHKEPKDLPLSADLNNVEPLKGSLKIASLQFFETRSEYEQTFFFNEDKTMHWADVVADSSLENLPYKIELNEHGQILMTPHWPLHSELQSVLQEELNQRMKGGRAVPEYAIRTAAGVRVADVVWRSAARWNEIQAAGKVPAPVAPEICIEVRSRSNTDAEMAEKRTLYLDAGALEMWTCDENGRLRFFDPGNELAQSNLVPSFPTCIEI